MRELCRLDSTDQASPKVFQTRHLEACRRKSPFVRRAWREEARLQERAWSANSATGR